MFSIRTLGLALLAFVSFSAALDGLSFEAVANPDEDQPHYFEQLLDHFDRSSSVTFKQRYFMRDFSDGDSQTPHINVVYLGGESPLLNLHISDEHPLYKLVQENHGRIYSIENRFYGESFPENCNQEVEGCLEYLTSMQVIQDIAWFIYQMDAGLHNDKRPGTTVDQWLVVGGSYSGALAAWFRNKYPHLARASWASSAVVNAYLEFPTFDKHVAEYLEKANPSCKAHLQSLVHQTGDLTEITDETVRQSWLDFIQLHLLNRPEGEAEMLTGDINYMVADVTLQAIQYSRLQMLCDGVEKAYERLVTRYTDVAEPFHTYTSQKHKTDAYSQTVVKDPKTKSAGRTWWWQTCTELAWWQNTAEGATDTMRHSTVDIQYHKDFCRNVFGDRIPEMPYTKWTNIYFGGNQEISDELPPLMKYLTRTFFYSGEQDPWLEASLKKVFRDDEKHIVSNIVWDKVNYLSGHCEDLHAPKKTDAADLTKSRQDAIDFIKNEFAAVLKA